MIEHLENAVPKPKDERPYILRTDHPSYGNPPPVSNIQRPRSKERYGEDDKKRIKRIWLKPLAIIKSSVWIFLKLFAMIIIAVAEIIIWLLQRLINLLRRVFQPSPDGEDE